MLFSDDILLFREMFVLFFDECSRILNMFMNLEIFLNFRNFSKLYENVPDLKKCS